MTLTRLRKPLPKYSKVVIIGAGMTGLALGALLSKAGYKVTLLEQHPVLIGGHARKITLPGCSICAGPQYIWGFGPGSIGSSFLEYLGIDRDVPFKMLDTSGFESVHLSSSHIFDVPMGLIAFRDKLIQFLPDETVGIRKFFSYTQEMSTALMELENTGGYLLGKYGKMMSILRSRDTSVSQKVTAFRFRSRSLCDVFDLCDLSLQARRILYAHAGVFAENESDVSFGIYAACTGLFHSGAYWPLEGFDPLLNSLSTLIMSGEGSVELGKDVNRLDRRGPLIGAVQCTDRSVYKADFVVSTISPRATLAAINPSISQSYVYEPSRSFNMCYMSLNPSFPFAEKLLEKNIWWLSEKGTVNFSNDNPKEPSMLYVGSLTSSTMSDTENTLPLVAFAPGDFDQSRAAAERSEECYMEYVNKIQERIVSTIERFLFPGFQQHLKHVQVLTPVDIEKELKAEWGNAYGRRLTSHSCLGRVPQIKKIKNLSIAGATISAPGIETCVRTACILFHEMTGRKLL